MFRSEHKVLPCQQCASKLSEVSSTAWRNATLRLMTRAGNAHSTLDDFMIVS